MASSKPQLSRLLETALYVADVSRSFAFYRDVLGLVPMEEGNLDAGTARGKSDFAALRFPDGCILLLFAKDKPREPVVMSGGTIPAHGGDGQLHIAFGISSSLYKPWEEALRAHGIVIESVQNWDRGGKSIYFRDPDGHLLELATPGVWSTY